MWTLFAMLAAAAVMTVFFWYKLGASSEQRTLNPSVVEVAEADTGMAKDKKADEEVLVREAEHESARLKVV